MPLQDVMSALSTSTQNLNIGYNPDELAPNGVAANGPKPTVEEKWPSPEGDDNKENEDVDMENGEVPAILGEVEPPKKKKKKRKPKGARKNPPPTGWEDNIVDGPFPPSVISLESELYSPSKSFAERIETCIQRYRSKRKFDPVRLQIFTSYLNLGGVNTGPKAFSGGIDHKNDDGETIEAMAATEYVDKDDDDSEWEVDFEYVVRGFLSYRVPYVLGYMKFEELELSAKVVRNFLNYVIYHSVAPEHNQSIRDAIAITDLAEKELVLCRHVSSRLPGNFNMACSTLYGGYYSGMKTENASWNGATLGDDVGLTVKEATEIVKACMEKRGTALQKETWPKMKLLKGEFISLEVTGIIHAGTSKVGKPLPEDIQKDIDGGIIESGPLPGEPGAPEDSKKVYECEGLNALGKLLVKVWEGDDEAPEYPQTDLDEFEIWLEMEALQYCFVGMHLEAKVHTMSNGVIWIDSVTGVKCSFFLHLESPDKESDDDDEYK